jgi:hypothetical protein
MQVFRIFLVVILSSAIVLSTVGLLVFTMYLIYLPFPGYATYVAIFSVTGVCAIILLAVFLHMAAAAAGAVAVGALLHVVIYLFDWSNEQAFLIWAAADAIILMIAMTVAYLYAQDRRPTGAVERKSFWSSLDPANKVSIITSLVSAIAVIVAAMIGLFPRLK